MYVKQNEVGAFAPDHDSRKHFSIFHMKIDLLRLRNANNSVNVTFTQTGDNNKRNVLFLPSEVRVVFIFSIRFAVVPFYKNRDKFSSSFTSYSLMPLDLEF